MSNKSAGSRFEREFANLLAKRGWWVHLLQQNAEGQPADIIAVKNSYPSLIDCKDCRSDFFRLSRIEANQEAAMRMWVKRGNDSAWFALRMSDGEIHMLDARVAFELEEDMNSLNEKFIRHNLIPFDDWMG